MSPDQSDVQTMRTTFLDLRSNEDLYAYLEGSQASVDLPVLICCAL